jgi:hypothetical protein
LGIMGHTSPFMPNSIASSEKLIHFEELRQVALRGLQ